MTGASNHPEGAHEWAAGFTQWRPLQTMMPIQRWMLPGAKGTIWFQSTKWGARLAGELSSGPAVTNHITPPALRCSAEASFGRGVWVSCQISVEDAESRSFLHLAPSHLSDTPLASGQRRKPRRSQDTCCGPLCSPVCPASCFSLTRECWVSRFFFCWSFSLFTRTSWGLCWAEHSQRRRMASSFRHRGKTKILATLKTDEDGRQQR